MFKENEDQFVLFWDMHSGGRLKEKWSMIFIQCPSEKEAKVIFYNRFGHRPSRVTCHCCGEDYSVYKPQKLDQATAFHRDCLFDEKAKKYVEKANKHKKEHVSIQEFLKRDDVLVIYASEIKDEWRVGDLDED